MLKKRLDVLIFEKNLAQSRERAKALIMAGQVMVNNVPIDKPGSLVLETDQILVKQDIKYVSRGGFKLEAALEKFKKFNLDVKNFDCIDVGASTGGFTDCLLQNQARQIFAIDVGYGQLAWKLQQDTRVVIIDRINIRNINFELINKLVDLIVIDVSFISLKIVIPSVLQFLKKSGKIIILIKPQFEVGKGKVGKGGIVKDFNLHNEVIVDLSRFFKEINLNCLDIIDSPIFGTKGNKEFIAFLEKNI